MRYLKCLLLACFVTILFIACKRQDDKLTDDTWYIVDEYSILMLCERPEQESFKALMVKLKGNGNSLNEAINILKEMEQDTVVKNALGVGYLRLRKFREAEEEFQEALNIAQSDTERVCILANLAGVMLYKEDSVSAENYTEKALELGVNDSLKNLVLKSNLTSINLSNQTELIQEIAKIKQLIKEEKSILGSNQFVGIFNYETLAYACYYEDNMTRCEYYMKKARELNKKTYKYVYIDAYLYKALTLMYDDTIEGVDKAMSYIDKDIDILEEWQTKDHYDLLVSYIIRGNLYANKSIPDRDSAIRDYRYVLDYCPPYHSLAAVSYYGLARAYGYSENAALITESYAKAYYLWKLEGWSDLNQDIERELRQEYERQNNGNESYNNWFEQQIEKAERDLEIQWAQ
ncbi:hypothetical protein [Clostridium sp. HBUAS56010]|uniref:hypothetical protein n=1 Tax=Clostridium sp. HBUAS56010 TaxID=2571127 RepID=UPI00117773D1|nr:hypothetical protein [Clostridium sp. HBUAS56010]